MKDPGLSPDDFLHDRVRRSELLFRPEDFAVHTGAPVSEGFIALTGAGPLRIDLPCAGVDLSPFDCLVLTVCNLSEAPVLAGVSLTHDAAEGESSCGLAPVSFSGGREILTPGRWEEVKFPAECFGFYGNPHGWTAVRGMELSFGREKGRTEPQEVKIAVRSLAGEVREIPPGPRLTAKGLEKVLAADNPRGSGRPPPEGGERPFPGRTGEGFSFPGPYHSGNPAMLIPPPHPYPRGDAGAILTGRIMGQSVPVPIPWGFNPLGAHEWTHYLNRHHFLRELAAAFAGTGDPRYARAIDDLISGWIGTNPVPVESNGGAGPAWETLSAAWRLREWLWVAGIVRPSTAFSATAENLMLRSLWEHSRSLMDHRGHPGNWRMVESAALALAGLCFPMFREAPLWTSEGLSRLTAECENQFLPDGSHCEISPLYHAICLHALIEVKEAARAAECPLPAPELVDGALERAAEFLAALCRPDFTWPSLNDSGGVRGDYAALLRKAGLILDRPDFLWIGTHGREGTTRARRSKIFPYAGLAVMTAGCGERSNFLVFRASPPGAAHRHEDVLGLDVTALGIPRLVDPGITTYAPGPLTRWYRSKAAHNLLTIEPAGPAAPVRGGRQVRMLPSDCRPARTDPAGLRPQEPQQERPHLLFRREGAVEAAIGTHSPAGPAAAGGENGCTLSRSVVFVDGVYWIVKDLVTGPVDGEASTSWQFHPGSVERDPETGALRCVTPGGPGFELTPLPGTVRLDVEVHIGDLDPPCGWVSVNGEDVPAAHFRCRWKTSFPATVLWLLLPFEESPVSGVRAGRTDAEDGSVRLDLAFPSGLSDAIVFRPPAAGRFHAGEISRGSIEFTRQCGEDPASRTILVL